MKNGIEDAIAIAPKFAIQGQLIYVAVVTAGHINDTFSYATSMGHYLVQRINRNVFKRPNEVMHNIRLTTDFIREKIISEGRDPSREVMSIVPAKDGSLYITDDNGDFWRVYTYVERAVSFNAPTSAKMFEETGFAFGHFQDLLSDFPVNELYETIPHFHDTVSRVNNLKKAAEVDSMKRNCGEAHDLYEGYLKETYLADLFANADVPLRVTHNDTKLNNILLDRFSHAPLCVIDLDTVMPGLSAFDFGDAIRFGANKGKEDEPDKAELDLTLFEAFAKGFIRACGESLTKKEIALLVEGAMDMTFECGCRFLTDYFEGDAYFKIAYPGQNLQRAKAQFNLLMDMEKHKAEMHRIIEEASATL